MKEVAKFQSNSTATTNATSKVSPDWILVPPSPPPPTPQLSLSTTLPNTNDLFPTSTSEETLKHRRVGSTGTTGTGTGDESYTTTDEEENFLYDELEANQNGEDCAAFASAFNRIDGSNTLDVVKNDEDVWTSSMVVVDKEEAFARLQDELRNARKELKLRDEEVARLSRIRQDVETELEDLTASLFQEAHNMVRDANEKQTTSEKALKESQMKVDVLTAEVSALKTLVLTSTPSRPNPHLHPQIGGGNQSADGIFAKKQHHRRSPSHFNLKYGRENSPPESPAKEQKSHTENCEGNFCNDDIINSSSSSSGGGSREDRLEVDPEVHREFLAWRQSPALDKNQLFIKRIYSEDIDVCLSFTCEELAVKVKSSIENGTIIIEAVGDRNKAMFPK